jgi:hypothetical protein
MKEVTFEWLLDATGTEPKRLKRIMDSLVKRGWWVKTETGYLITAEGLREAFRGDLYGYPGIILIEDILNVRNLIRKLSEKHPGTEVTINNVYFYLPQLVIKDKKIGRLLRTLGCTVRKSNGKTFYRIPEKVIERELRDLTRTKNYQRNNHE